MVRRRKERITRSTEYDEEQERRRESQRTEVSLWKKGTRICVAASYPVGRFSYCFLIFARNHIHHLPLVRRNFGQDTEQKEA